jgi:transposase
MTDRTVNNLPAATHGEPVRCLFAIELSRKSWVIAFNTPLSEKISRRTLTGCKWKGLLELIEQVRARVSRETGRTVEVVSCYEAGYDGFWLHRQLEATAPPSYKPGALAAHAGIRAGAAGNSRSSPRPESRSVASVFLRNTCPRYSYSADR